MSINLTTTRRRFILASGAATVALSSALPALAATKPDPAKLAVDAAIWGFTLVSTGRYLKFAAEKKVPFNQFYVNHDRPRPDAFVAGPNADLLYGMAWIDLSAEPQILEVPDTHDRYYSIMLMDAYQSPFLFVGRRETGTKGSLRANSSRLVGHASIRRNPAEGADEPGFGHLAHAREGR
jgi:hypothetical protein